MDETLQRLRKWADDPISFCEDVFADPPWDWQKDVLEKLKSNTKIAIRSGHGVGKSNLLGRVILWFLCTRFPSKCIITAPTKHQIFDILIPEITILLNQMIPELRSQIEISGEKIYLKGADQECFAVCRTARKETPEAFQGIHSSNVLIIVDEASGVDDEVFLTGEGSLSTSNSYCVLASNPTRRSGFFADIFLKRSQDDSRLINWAKVKVSCLDSPGVDPNYIKYIENKYGKDSNNYRIRVLGEFPTSDEDVLIPRYLIDQAVEMPEIEQANYKPIWGLDVSRFGKNKTVLVRRVGRQVEQVQEWMNMDSIQVSGRVAAEYRLASPKPKIICIDVVGPGSGVYDRLSNSDIPCYAVVGNAASIWPEKHLNARMDNFERMLEWFNKVVKIPNDEYLVEQLSELYTKYTVNDKIRMLTKHEFKDKGIESPDYADALALTFADEDEIDDDITEIEDKIVKVRRYTRKWKETKKTSYMAR